MKKDGEVLYIAHVNTDGISVETHTSKTSSKIAGLCLSPELYEIHAENYSGIKPSDAVMALKTLLPTIIPGSIDDYAIDSKGLQQQDGEYRVVAIIIRQQILDLIQEEFPSIPLILPAASALLKGEIGRIQFVLGDNSDDMVLDNTTAIPATGILYDRERSRSNGLPPEPIESTKTIEILDMNDPLSRYFEKASLLTHHRTSTLATLTLLFSVILLIVSGIILRQKQNDLVSYQSNTAAGEEDIERIAVITRELNHQEDILTMLGDSAPVSAYALLSSVIDHFPSETRITSIVCKEHGFTIRGESPDVMAAVRILEESQLISDLRLQQLTPRDDRPWENFTVSGVFDGR